MPLNAVAVSHVFSSNIIMVQTAAKHGTHTEREEEEEKEKEEMFDTIRTYVY